MKGALAIAANDLKRISRERSALFWIFVGPLLFTAFFGVLFRAQSPRVSALAIVNRDATDTVARVLTLILRQDGVESRPASEVGEEGFTLEILQGTSDAMAAGKPVQLVLHTPEEDETNAERRLRFRVEKALVVAFLQANPADLPPDADSDAITLRLNENRTITLKPRDIGIKRRIISSGFQRSVAAYLVMFVFMNVLVSGAGIAEERASGQLRRLFIAPLSKAEIVAGKLLGKVALGWIQAAWMMTAGIVLFRIQWAEHPFVFLGFVTLFALAAASIGLLLGTLFRDPDKALSAAIWGIVILSPLGGLWWPLEVVGPTMRTIGHLVPTGWAMEAVNSMLAYGAGAVEVAPYAAGFAALAAIALTFTVWKLRP